MQVVPQIFLEFFCLYSASYFCVQFKMARFKRFLFFSFITAVVLFLLTLCVALFFGDEIRKNVIAQLNTRLSAPVTVGEIYYSITENFPQASVVFNDISLEESHPVNKEKLASFKKVSVTLNLWDVLRKKIRIRRLIFEEGHIHAAIDKKGNNNFSVIKPSDSLSTESSSAQTFRFDQIQLNQVDISYEDESTGFFTRINSENLQCGGNFQEAIFDLKINGQSKVTLINGNTILTREQPVSLNTQLSVNQKEERVFFKDTRIKLSELEFALDGFWRSNDKGGGKVNLEGKDLEIKQLLSLLPGVFTDELEKYGSSGELSIRGSVEQKSSQDALRLKTDFSVHDGTLFISEFEEGLKNIHLEGSFEWSEESKYLRIPRLEALLMEDRFSGSMQLNHLKDPVLELNLDASVNVANIQRIIDLGSYNGSTGHLSLNIKAAGKLSDFQNAAGLGNTEIKGHIKGENLQLSDTLSTGTLRNLRFDVDLGHLETKLNYLDLNWNGNDFQIKGVADNLSDYLFNNGVLEVHGSLKSDRVHFKTPDEKQAAEGSIADSAGFAFPERIRLTAAVDIGEFSMDRFRAAAVSGVARLDYQKIEISSLQFKSCQGEVRLKGRLTRNEKGEHVILANARLNKVNIKELFGQFNNFGQQEITDKNLNGQLSGETDIGFRYDRQFNFLPATLFAFIDIRVDNGELNKYEPLKALSKFIRVEDLENIRFQTLTNQIEIRDRKIVIPQMEIKNNALNLMLEGEHTFENFMNYSVRLQLKDVLARSYTGAHPEDEFEQEEQGINVFIRMQGPADKLTFKYDSKQARKNFREEMKKEGNVVKELFRKELGIQKPADNKKPEGSGENSGGWEEDIPE